MIVMLSVLPLEPVGAQDEPAGGPREPSEGAASVGISATFTVNSTLDAVDANIGNGVCATAGAVCTLRAAIQEANSTVAADSIILANGIYTLTVTGVNEDSAASGDLDILQDLTITGASSLFTVIDGANADRIFDIFALADVTLQNLAIRRGRALSGGLYGDRGGGLITGPNNIVTLNNVVVLSNTAGEGGGIYAVTVGTQPQLILNNSRVVNNTSGGIGAGIFNEGRLTVSGSGFVGNISSNSGGGIWNPVGATLTMTASYLELNQAGSGGGLNNTGTAIVIASELAYNTVAGSGGGISNGGTLTMTNTTLSFNSADLMGGGLSSNGLAKLNNVTVYSNTAPTGQGGGIWDGGSVLVSNSLVAGNTGGNCNRPLLTQGNNLDSANTCGFTIGPGDLLNTNPLLDPQLRDNGPYIAFTHALLPGSPAIDRGNNATCPPTDQRGVARVDGDRNGSVVCDIGAFEYEPPRVFLPLVLKP
jgi:CSLREA domain-containing protein